MRIQHNITAMNAYRNYNNNTSAIGKNLEKLSSGYKINRAGDDAAGLAVSQKMRLQIAGLEQAQKNAKSGISYVQTAEGALQEVHEMLERMYTLAEQSANGTFDSTTDRTQLQKEVNNLLEEINRIGKTANFNGIGIFAEYAGGGGTTSTEATYYDATSSNAGFKGTEVAATTTPAKAAVYEIDVTNWQAGDKLTIDGTTISYTAATDFDAYKAAAVDSTDKNYTIKYDDTSKKLTITAKKEGQDNFKLADTDLIKGTKASATETTKGVAETKVPKHNTYNVDSLTAGDTITVNGKTFKKAAADDADKGEFKDFAGLKAAAAKQDIEVGGTENAATFTKKAGSNNNGGGKDIQFWVGAENGTDNILTIKTMHLSHTNITIDASTTGANMQTPNTVTPGNLTNLNISDATSAMACLTTIKTASDAVSDMRGTLGAMQNRLDHTIKNLSVMQENMQDAESVIRDTDVAEEMMAYTKNSILVQSAQAMLAQANQLPQGVLQLLQ